MDEKSKYALVTKSTTTLEKAGPGTKRVLSSMVTDAIALVKKQRPKLRIICVDDDLSILDLFTQFIPAWFKDAALLTFQDGDLAWRELTRANPDVLLMDIMHPGLDGWMMASLLAEEKVKYPIIVVSAYDEYPEFCGKNNDLDAAFTADATKFHNLLQNARKTLNITPLAKPFDLEELRMLLETKLRSNLAIGDFGALQTPCPKCGGELHEGSTMFQCSKCDFGFCKIIADRQLEVHEVEKLVAHGRVGPLNGFRGEKGEIFSTILELSNEFKVELGFGEGPEEGNQNPGGVTDASGQELLGLCPMCGNRVYEMNTGYACEMCNFRVNKFLLKQPISREQMRKLLQTGKTDLLEGFVSVTGGFAAHLIIDDGNVVFEFPASPQET